MKMNEINLLGFIDEARHLRPQTKRVYTYTVKQWLDFAGTDPVGWTPLQAQAFYDHLISKGHSANTTNRLVSGGLAFALKRANQLYGLPLILAGLNKFRQHYDADAPSKRHALTSPQAKSLLTACSGSDIASKRDEAMVLIALYTGLRRMSLISLTMDSVADEGAYVTLRTHVKGGHWDRCPIDKRLWQRIEPYRRALTALRPPTDALFPRLRPRLTEGTNALVPEGALTEDGLYKQLMARAAVAKLPKFHPHIFRHTFVSWCRSAKIEDYLIEVVTGHRSSKALVNRVYTDKQVLHAEVARRCYEAITAQLVDS